MNARTLPVLLVLALLTMLPTLVSATPAGQATAARPRSPLLRGADCLEPGMARGFVSLDDHSLLVDAGHNYYRIEVSPACWNLDMASVVAFRGDPLSNRVCGNAMDRLIVRGNSPCAIERMELLDKAGYKQLLREHEAAHRARREAAKKSGAP